MKDVHFKMAPRYEEFDGNGNPLAMRLIKSLYGLRQTLISWVDKHLLEIGFKIVKPNLCVYTYSEGKHLIILTLYVDEFLLLGKDLTMPRGIIEKLMGRFPMTGMGDASLVLGVGVIRYRRKGTVTISQEKYTNSFLERYGMANCNPAYTLVVGKEVSLNQQAEKLLGRENRYHFKAITLPVIYLAQMTRYDIM